MKIYTKTGDKGSTALVGGTRVSKSNLRLECYGTIDELNSHLGLAADFLEDKALKQSFLEIQYRLFSVGADLANESDSRKKVPVIRTEDIEFLEKEIDTFNSELEAMKFFILPGGHKAASFCHVARTVCRRVERLTVRLAETEQVNEMNIKYLNRLSDYLFVAARKILKDNNIDEIPWKPYL